MRMLIMSCYTGFFNVRRGWQSLNTGPRFYLRLIGWLWIYDIAFNKLARSAREETEDQWEAKVDKYLNDGMTESEAKHKANRKLRDDELHKFLWKNETLLQYLLQLRVGKLHSMVMDMVDEIIEEASDFWLLLLSFSIQPIWTCNHWWSEYHSTWESPKGDFSWS